MTAQTADSVLAAIRKVPLLEPGQLARAEAAARQGPLPPDRLVGRMVRAGWLTPYQGSAVLAGTAGRLAFGPYVLLDRLGDGGMGVVYAARHARLGRVDAVKVIRTDKLASRGVVRRFLREIRLASSLDHPNVVRALDAGVVGDRLYLASELVRGRDLARVVREGGPLSPATACLAVYHAALALEAVRARGLVHRDLKPSNLIRVDATGAVKLLDMGLSGFHRRVGDPSESGTLTRDGVMLGTPDFMAPEQIGDPHRVDTRADLYSLGCTFFYLLTGRMPYDGPAVEKLQKHATAPPPRLVLPDGRAHAGVEAIIHRLMAKDPRDRYPTPRALIDAMLALRPDSPVTVSAAPAAAAGYSSDDPESWTDTFRFEPARATVAAAAPTPPGRGVSPWVLLSPVVAALLALGVRLLR